MLNLYTKLLEGVIKPWRRTEGAQLVKAAKEEEGRKKEGSLLAHSDPGLLATHWL